ncbi:hypothetical protein [Azospirillum sp.]|uniref:hypothetical protein n=1 Tax=Azospirillum sp. TaxID=34012 RepID=UPI003D73C013
MRTSLHFATALTLATALTAASAAHAQPRLHAQAPTIEEHYASPLIPPKLPPQAVPQEVAAAWGCVLAGTAGTVAALGANSVNLLNVVAGGLVNPANPAVLYLGLAGVVFTSFCTLGQQLTPLYVYYFRGEPDTEIDLAKDVRPRMASAARPLPAEDEEHAYPWQAPR